jgi:mannosyltransferase
MDDSPPYPRAIAACLGRRYSGINASMLAVVPRQNDTDTVVAIGRHVPAEVPSITWRELWALRADGCWRVWHARRNTDMIIGLLLRHVLGFRFKLLFTSAAIRRHTWTTRWLYARMDAVIATTAKAAACLTRPATVVMHGVNTERFHPPASKQEAWRELAARHGLGGEYGVGVFGRIRESKGTGDFVEALLTALPRRAGMTAVIVGEATAEHRGFEQALRDKLGAAGLTERVHFAGFVPNDEVPLWHRAVSVVVCPSRSEGFGLPCLEAMASGCGVVTTTAGAWPEIVSEGVTGRVVPPARPDLLAEAVLDLTADAKRLAGMGASARADVVERFAISREVAGIRAVYDQLLS